MEPKTKTKILALAVISSLCGGVAIPWAQDKLERTKERIVSELIGQELQRRRATVEPQVLQLQYAQCRGQLEEATERLATIAVAVDLSDID